MEFFKKEKLSEHIYRIIGIDNVCCYLIVGNKKAALLDTGTGYGDIKAVIESITDKETIVILTHAHHDHMGGAGLFNEVYMNLDDMPVYNQFGSESHREFYAKEDAEKFNFTIDKLIPTYNGEIKGIKEGDIFDLGGITIEMILVKGHTPGMMCPLIKEERTIIFGDACGVAVMLFDKNSSNVSEYRNSLLHLKTFENDYDTIYRNHGTFTSPKELLDNVIECCDLILAGKDDHQYSPMHNIELYAAKKTGENGRIDGKEGNIFYALDKAK